MTTSPVASMFDRISPKYDRLNHLLSFNIDKNWRRKTTKIVAQSQPKTILDLAAGTADLTIELAKQNPQAHIIGMDISEKMLEIGKQKVTKLQMEKQIELRLGDAAALPFGDNSFDAVTVAFGVRNFEDLGKGLSEISRVLKPGGQAIILEFSMPERFPVKQLYRFYFKRLLPFIGRIVSKDKGAYSYLPQSVERFFKQEDFCKLLTSFNLKIHQVKRLTFGICTLFITSKA